MCADRKPHIVAVIPIKPLALSKSRLAPALPDTRRHALSLMLLHHVLACVRRTRQPIDPWVVGGDPLVETLSRREGAEPVAELGSGPNETVERAALRAFSQGADAAIYLPPDLPLLQAADLDALMDASDELHKLVLAPAQRDGGTNAILMPRGLAFRPHLAEGHSFQKHQNLARRNGWPHAVCRTQGLALDLDTPADLAVCLERATGFLQQLRRWEAFLESGANVDAAPFSQETS